MDGVCPEMLKAEDTETPKLLCQILQKIWDSEKAPKDWNTGVIVKLPKKIWQTATTGEESPCYPSPARSLAASFSNASQQLWTAFYARNRQALGRANLA